MFTFVPGVLNRSGFHALSISIWSLILRSQKGTQLIDYDRKQVFRIALWAA
jgi:hypothetical protein